MTSDDDFYIYKNAYLSSIVLYTFHIIVLPPSDECLLVCGTIDTGAYELVRSKADKRKARINKTITKSTRFSFIFLLLPAPTTATTRWQPRESGFILFLTTYMILRLPACHLGWFFFSFFSWFDELVKIRQVRATHAK